MVRDIDELDSLVIRLASDYYDRLLDGDKPVIKILTESKTPKLCIKRDLTKEMLKTGYSIVIKDDMFVTVRDDTILHKSPVNDGVSNVCLLDIDDEFNLLPMKDVKLFLVTRNDVVDYGEYMSILVACQTQEQAKDVMKLPMYNDGIDLDMLVATEVANNYNGTIYIPKVIMDSYAQ